MKKFIILIIIFFQYTSVTLAMTNKPYHHLDNGKFRNPEGSPVRSENVKWSYSTFNKEKKKLDMTVPDEHVIKKNLVLEKLNSIQNNDYIGWIGHATFLIKLGNTTIITDPVFSKNAGPLIFGPKRYTEPALNLNELPKIDLFFDRCLNPLWCHFGFMRVAWGHFLVAFDIESDVDVHKWRLGGAENRKY